MFYYAEINSDYLVVAVHCLTEASTNAKYVVITEDQYNNGNLVNKYYNSLTGDFEIMVSTENSGASDWFTYRTTLMVLTTKLDNMQAEINSVTAASSTNYDESIIGLSVDGQTITYIKGDGSVHMITTQDTNTEYSLATDTTTGLTKLYATTGTADDGTMTQRAIKTALDNKVNVSVDSTQDLLVFTV